MKSHEKVPKWLSAVQEKARNDCSEPYIRQKIRYLLRTLVELGGPSHTYRSALVNAVRCNVWVPFNIAKGDTAVDKIRTDMIAQILDSLVLEGEITEYKASTGKHPVRRYRIDAPASDR